MAANAININHFEINSSVENQIQALLNEASSDKEKKAVSDLKKMLVEVMGTLSSKGSAKTEAAVVLAKKPSGSSYEEAIVLLAGALAEMQILLTQIVKNKAENDAQVDQLQLDALEGNIKVVADLIQQQIDAQNNASIWKKVAACFMTVVGGILTALGMPEIGIPMMVLGVLQITGVMDQMTHAIANYLEHDCGMSEKAATILADALVVVAVTVASMGVGGVAGAIDSAATNALDEGVEMSALDAAGNVIEEGGANAAKQGASIAARVRSGAFAGFFQSAASTNLASNLVAAIPFSDSSEGKLTKKILEVVATLAMVAASIVASFGTGAVSAISKLPSSFMINAGRLSYLAQAGAGVASIGAGAYGIQTGLILSALAGPQAIAELQETTLGMMGNDEKATAKFMASIQQTFQALFALLNKMFVGQKAMADVMARA